MKSLISKLINNITLLSALLLVIFTGVLLFNTNIYAQEDSGAVADSLAVEIAKIQSDGRYIAALLFNAFGSNPDGAWAPYVLSDADIREICGGNCGKIGVNSAALFSQGGGFYSRAQSLGMQHVLEIAKNDVGTTVAGLSAANASGLTPVIRIGVGGDSLGFSDPQAYVDFLKAIDSSVNFTVYAIAGPNEPESELWATPTCGRAENAECIGAGLASYMNAVIAGAGGLTHVRLLSPAFNMTNKASPPIVKAMIRNGANFDGVVAIAGNSYNISGRGITSWVEEFMDVSTLESRPVYLTEIGAAFASNSQQEYVFDYSTKYSCEAMINPEFHSLRPYPASPCDVETTGTTMCSNDLIVKQTFKMTMDQALPGTCRPEGDGFNCEFIVKSSARTKIDLSKADLPIVGNTELVPNAEHITNSLPFSTRMNEYVSWYLNGVINRAEEKNFSANNPADVNTLINFSGPLRKLLPQGLQQRERFEQGIRVDSKNPKEDRHNQIVACGTKENPTPCQPGPHPSIVRITDVASLAKGITQILMRLFIGLTPYPTQFITGNLAQLFVDFRDQTSLPAFQYVPFSSTEDRQAPAQQPAPPPNQEYNEVQLTNVTFTPTSHPEATSMLYFAHIKENSELAYQLQSTFIPQGKDPEQEGEKSKTDEYNGVTYCELDDARDNAGDSLHGDLRRDAEEQPIEGIMQYDAKFRCHLSREVQDLGGGQFRVVFTCLKDIYVGSKVFIKTPLVEEQWQFLVSGAWSVVKRMLPKVGPNTPIEELEDIPGKTIGGYSASHLKNDIGRHIETKALAGDPGKNRPGTSANLFFPHLGSIQEYFLKDIQKALLPKGAGQGTHVPDPNGNGSGTGGSTMACNPSNFASFGADASKVACVCDKESVGGKADALNTGCLLTGPKSTWDYSVGLFQINLLVHPNVAPPDLIQRFKDAGYSNAEKLNCPSAFSSIGKTYKDGKIYRMTEACVVQDQKLLDICVDYYSIPANNVWYAADLAKRDGWKHWSLSASACGLL